MYQFEIPGPPVPQAQLKFRHLKDGRDIPYNPSREAIERVKWFIRPLAPVEPIGGPVCLEIVFYMPIPKTTPKAKRRQMNDRIILPICRPDEDNLSYLVTNALKQIVYKDDSQICKKVVHKYYSDDPRTVVTVTKMCTAYHNGTETEQEIICH